MAASLCTLCLACRATCRLLVLAPGAEVGAAIPYRNALYGRATVVAYLAAPVGHPELEMGRAQLATRPVVVDDACPLLADSLLQHLPDGAMQPFHLVRRQATARPQRMNPGSEQDLIGIHVANTGNQVLVTKQRLYQRSTVAQQPGQEFHCKACLKWLRAQLAHDCSIIGHQPHPAELALVTEVKLRAIIQADDGPHEPVISQVPLQQERAAHLEVNDQALATAQAEAEVLASAGQAGDSLPDKAGAELPDRRLPYDSLPGQANAGNSPSDNMWLKLILDCFNFR